MQYILVWLFCCQCGLRIVLKYRGVVGGRNGWENLICEDLVAIGLESREVVYTS